MSLFPNNFIRRVGATLAVVAVLALAISRIGGGIQFPFGAQPTSATQVWIPVEPQIDIAWVPGHEEGPYVSARAAILFENTTGTVLYAKNAHERRPPASTTKILTAIMALEMSRLDEIVTVSRRAASTPGSTARLYTGQKIRMDDLLHGLLLRSGNDAAVAIAEHLAGSESAFVSWMNQRAAALRCDEQPVPKSPRARQAGPFLDCLRLGAPFAHRPRLPHVRGDRAEANIRF